MVSLSYNHNGNDIWYDDRKDGYWHTMIGDVEGMFMSPKDAIEMLDEYANLLPFVGLRLCKLNVCDTEAEIITVTKLFFDPDGVRTIFIEDENGNRYNKWDNLYPMGYYSELEELAKLGKKMRDAMKKFRAVEEEFIKHSINYIEDR